MFPMWSAVDLRRAVDRGVRGILVLSRRGVYADQDVGQCRISSLVLSSRIVG